jgi:hypothetical protein
VHRRQVTGVFARDDNNPDKLKAAV